MLSPISTSEQDLLGRVRNLAQGVFLERAECYDEGLAFPAENFDDLFSNGLMMVPVSRKWGGLECAPAYGNVIGLWRMTVEIAQADLSFSRCWEGHNNAMLLLDALGTDEQKERWFTDVAQNGARWAAWSGEPQSRVPGQKRKVGTTLEKVSGGYIVSGNKVFATSAPGANWAILLVSQEGPGAARDSRNGENSLMMMACNLSDATVSFGDKWWNPIGMRSTVSYQVNFADTFIPDENVIGEVGQYIRDGFQAYFTPQYAASFFGAASGAFESALMFVRSQGKQSDPFIQQHVAAIQMNLDTLDLWLQDVATKVSGADKTASRIAGSKLRWLAETLSEDTVKRCVKMCGARSLNKPSRLERVYRDLSIYTLHDNADHMLANVGRELLGEPTQDAFFAIKT